jgi:branched-chain amino acid transport system substrate-binding protein
MAKTIRLASFAAIALVYLLAVGCRAPQEDIKIGLIAMLSGPNASNGRDMKDSATLAVSEVNAIGGIMLGNTKRKVSLIVEDDHGIPDDSVSAARKLISVDRVISIVGPQFSSNAIPVAALAEGAKVVMIAPMSTNPLTTAGKRYVFRVPYLDTFQGHEIAHFAVENIKARTAAVLYDVAGDYNRTLAEVFTRTFEEYGGKVVASETYTTDNNKDFKAQLGRISSRKPDVLFLPNYAADALVQANEARALGIKAVLIGGDGWDTKAFAKEEAFQASFASRQWHPSLQTAEALHFSNAFLTSYHRVPEDVAATTYDAFGLLIAALQKAGGTDGEALRQSLSMLRGYRWVTGSITYESTGDPVKSAVIVKLQNGEESVYTVVQP